MYTPPLKQYYKDSILPALQESRGYKNVHEVPGLEKIVVNSGLSSELDRGAIDETVKEITNITGQKPIVTKARRSVSNFKLREGVPNGVKVTLRGKGMYEFLYRMISVALPGIRDFRGISDKLDGHGNYSLGISDHTIFPEVNMDSSKRMIGMDITIVTSAETDEGGKALLEQLGMPFRKRENR